MTGEMQPWRVPNFVRVLFQSDGEDSSGVPVPLHALPPERLEEQLERFCAEVRAKAQANLEKEPQAGGRP